MSEDSEQSGPISEFLDSKGATELICMLGDDRVRWSELDSKIDISSSTLSNRLGEAENLLLIEPHTVSTKDSGREPAYQLTDLGLQIFDNARDRGVLGLFESLIEIREDYENKKDELIDWVENNEDAMNEKYRDDNDVFVPEPPAEEDDS